MDAVEQYLLMCEKAWPFLTTIFDYRDVVFSRSRGTMCRTSYKQDAGGNLKPVFIRMDSTDLVEADDFFIVWQERQLQDMIVESNITYSQYAELRDSSPFFKYLPKEADGSLMQNAALLAVIVYERYGKAWTGEDWVDVRKE
ncbi:MAG: hypothetical protein ACOC58_01855 [Chloroflexota bacterium]